MIVDTVPFIQARWRYGKRGNVTNWIVLHSMEAPEGPRTARGCAQYFATTDRQASTQFCVDANETIRCADLDEVVAGARGANHTAIHIEQAGYANQSAQEWRDEYSMKMIREQVAPLVAELCQIYQIPPVFVDSNGIRIGQKGITTHHEVWKVFGGDYRYDPGPNYPMNELIDCVQGILGDDDMTPQDRQWLEQKFAEVHQAIASNRDVVLNNTLRAAVNLLGMIKGDNAEQTKELERILRESLEN